MRFGRVPQPSHTGATWKAQDEHPPHPDNLERAKIDAGTTPGPDPQHRQATS